jgi:hypothetical protein
MSDGQLTRRIAAGRIEEVMVAKSGVKVVLRLDPGNFDRIGIVRLRGRHFHRRR